MILEQPKNTIEEIVDNLFYVLPLIHKKLLKIEAPDTRPSLNLSRIHFGTMAIIHEERALPISEVARRLLIPKPQMTHIVAHLESCGLVARQISAQDRRIASIRLTPAGQAVFQEIGEFLKDNVRRNLSYFSEKELEELCQILARLRELGSKLQGESRNGVICK